MDGLQNYGELLSQQGSGYGVQQQLGNLYAGAATQWVTTSTTSSTGIQPEIPQPNNDPVAWLKKRVKEIEWRA